MRKRERDRQWYLRANHQYGEDILTGNNKRPSSRLKQVQIGEWLKIVLLNDPETRGRERYQVSLGDDVYLVQFVDDKVSINLIGYTLD